MGASERVVKWGPLDEGKDVRGSLFCVFLHPPTIDQF